MSSGYDPVTGRQMVDPSVYSVEFKPRATARRFVGLLTLVCLGATAYAGWVAWNDRTYLAYGAAGIFGVLTIILWAAWASTPVSHLHVHGGVLEVHRAGHTERFDLTSHYTKIRTVGSPRSGKWKVLIERPADSPFVIDRAMVDPRHFTRVLEAYHHVA